MSRNAANAGAISKITIFCENYRPMTGCVVATTVTMHLLAIAANAATKEDTHGYHQEINIQRTP